MKSDISHDFDLDGEELDLFAEEVSGQQHNMTAADTFSTLACETEFSTFFCIGHPMEK